MSKLTLKKDLVIPKGTSFEDQVGFVVMLSEGKLYITAHDFKIEIKTTRE